MLTATAFAVGAEFVASALTAVAGALAVAVAAVDDSLPSSCAPSPPNSPPSPPPLLLLLLLPLAALVEDEGRGYRREVKRGGEGAPMLLPPLFLLPRPHPRSPCRAPNDAKEEEEEAAEEREKRAEQPFSLSFLVLPSE